MKSTTTSLYPTKSANSIKEKPKTLGYNLSHSEQEHKPGITLTSSTSTRHYFSALADSSTPSSNKRQTTTSSLISPKPSTSTTHHPHHSMTVSLAKYESRLASKDKQPTFFQESKKSSSSNSSQSRDNALNKRSSLNKFSSPTSHSTLAKRTEQFTSLQDFKKKRLQAQSNSRTASKENSLTRETPLTSKQNAHKERLFGSFDPTAVGSGKRTYLHTDTSTSDKKQSKEGEANDYISTRYNSAAGTTSTFQSESPLSKSKSYGATSHLLAHHYSASGSPIINRSSKGTVRSTKTDILLNNMISPTIKRAHHERSSKGSPRSFQEQDNYKLNISSEHASLGYKGSSSNSIRSNNLSQNEQYKKAIPSASAARPHANISYTTTSSPNTRAHLVTTPKDYPTVHNSLSFGSLYKEKRVNYHEFLRGKREDYDKSMVNQSTANQTLKSTANSNSHESSERVFNRKSNPSDAGSSRAANFKSLDLYKNSHGEISVDNRSSYERYKSNSNTLTDNSTLAKKHGYSKTGTECLIRPEYAEVALSSSAKSSENVSRSQSIAQNIKEIIEFEKKKSEALHKRISLNFVDFKLHKDSINTTPVNDEPHLSPAVNRQENTLQSKAPATSKHSQLSRFDFSAHSNSYPRATTPEELSIAFKSSGNPSGYKDVFSELSHPSSTKNERELPSYRDNISSARENREPHFFSKSEADGASRTTPVGTINFIEFEEVLPEESEKLVNSRNRKTTFRLESDRTEVPTSGRRKTEGNLIMSHSELESRQMSAKDRDGDPMKDTLENLMSRMKRVLGEHRSKEDTWQREKASMQERIDDLEKQLHDQKTSS